MITTDDYTELLREYERLIDGPSDEAVLLETVPWFMGWGWAVPHLRACLKAEAPRFAEMADPPAFSLITSPRGSSPHDLNGLILSLRLQSWFRWELIVPIGDDDRVSRVAVAEDWARRDRRIRILEHSRQSGDAENGNAALRRATGNFFALVEDAGLLHPCALGVLARKLAAARELNLIYTHEAILSPSADRLAGFRYKPAFDVFTLLRSNYVGRLTAIRRDLIEAAAAGGPAFRSEYDGAGAHDLLIRLALSGQARECVVPLFLYYDRSDRRCLEPAPRCEAPAGDRLLDESLRRAYPGFTWRIIPPGSPADNIHHGVHLTAAPGRPAPSLLAIVPFVDQPELTLACLESLERQQHDLRLHVRLVDNRSADPETARILDEWLSHRRRNDYRIIEYDGAFNYGRLHNRIIREHGGAHDLLLFLNNDVELITSDGLQAMAMQLLADQDCGFVGIRLHYPGGSVQHGGVKVCDEDTHAGGFARLEHARTREEYVGDERCVLGVTFACAMTRRAVFEALGGFEEVLIPNSYGDVDLCLRAVRAGLRNVCFGTIEGIHHESRTRSHAADDAEFLAIHERHADLIADWRLKDLRYANVPVPARAAPALLHSTSHSGATGGLSDELPLRYRVADRLNGLVKHVAGPAHGLVKRGVERVHSGVRSPQSGPAPGRSVPCSSKRRPDTEVPAGEFSG